MYSSTEAVASSESRPWIWIKLATSVTERRAWAPAPPQTLHTDLVATKPRWKLMAAYKDSCKSCCNLVFYRSYEICQLAQSVPENVYLPWHICLQLAIRWLQRLFSLCPRFFLWLKPIHQCRCVRWPIAASWICPPMRQEQWWSWREGSARD